MADWLVGVAAIVILCFGFVVAFGAPYLPTLNRQTEAALELVDLKPGQMLLELGCGDGKVLLAAARHGYKAVGYELNPLLALVAWLRTRHYRKQVKVVWGNFFTANWPQCDAIFIFGLPRIMSRLDKKVAHETRAWPLAPADLKPASEAYLAYGERGLENLPVRGAKLESHDLKKIPVKLVSFAFTIPGKDPVKEKDGVYLYKYGV